MSEDLVRTLVVDDDFRVAALHRCYTERVPGFVVVGEALSGAAALDGIESLRPDLVLLDMYLPDIGEDELLRRLRHPDRPAVDVIAVTSARDPATLRLALRHGVVHYLVKPFSFGAFQEKLERYRSLGVRLSQLAHVDQREVDALYNLLRTSTCERLPKGLSGVTMDAVLAALRETPGHLTAADVGARAGVSRVTARRYLDHLCTVGRARLTLRYGSTGRPQHRYLACEREAPPGDLPPSS